MIAIKMPAVTQAMGSQAKRFASWADVPYGSHYAHARFQAKRGPAIALVGAVGTIGAGVSAGGLLGGIMIAGGVASALGTITGNKTLSTIGAVAGIAGLGASAFVNSAGNFVNPLTNFGDSVMGGTLSSMKDGLGKFFSNLTGGANNTASAVGAQTGDMIADAASAVVPDTSAAGMTKSLVDSSATNGIKLGNDALTNLRATPASSGGGLISSLGGSKDLLNLGLGAAQGYQQGQILDQQRPLIDARVSSESANTNLTNLQTQQLQNRMNNMQAQPDVGLSVNQDAQVFQNNGSQPGKMLVIVNGQVQYVTPQEAQALSQSGQGGLITSGA